ncbi:MAG: prepilin-type N-terminal cleavage/methylation domain-containing protein [Coleofasciculaceae cyanobacterium]
MNIPNYMKKLNPISHQKATQPEQKLAKQLAWLAKYQRSHSVTNSGFTLIEVIVVVLIIAILSTIAAPGWLGFLSQRRVNAANEDIWSTLQKAQTEAKRRKLSYSVSFRTDGGVPQVATYLSKNPDGTDKTIADIDANTWKVLGKDFELKPGQVVLGTNITGDNEGDNDINYALETEEQTITFDYQGNLAGDTTIPNDGLIIAAAAPRTDNADQPIESTMRCVKMRTIIGSMQIGRGAEECNPDP